MKIGIDSYCYHRFFGEVYPQQAASAKRMTLENFLDRAHQLSVDGVSLESCFISPLEAGYLSGIRQRLDSYALERVYAWGHPDGLEGGRNLGAYDDMIAALDHAKTIGASVMRIVGSSLRFRHEPHGPQIERLSRMLSEAVTAAGRAGIKLAVENHIDFTADEMLTLIRNVNSPHLGINFDTGNFLRLLDDPIKAMEKLAPYVYATHIKDLRVQKGVAADAWYFFSCTPVGDGVVDNERLARILHRAGYQGFLAVEIDCLHPDYAGEDAAVEQSVRELRRIASAISGERAESVTRPA